MVVTVLWWAVIVGGLVPTSWFLWRFRPAWPIRSPSLIVNGLVAVAWLMYLRSALVMATHGGVPAYDSWVDTALSLGLGGLVDILLGLLLVTFLRYRRQWHEERSEKSTT
jgi:hypothetical protein